MASIEGVFARQILDSRGNPTVEVEVVLDDGSLGRAAVPSGASTGVFEAVELRDGGEAYGGKAVTRAVQGVIDEMQHELLGFDADDQRLDRPGADRPGPARRTSPGWAPTPSSASAWPWPGPRPSPSGLPLFRYVGGPNAHVLPVPMMNILNGGAHADTNVDIQEFMIAPVGAATFSRGGALGRRDLPRAEGGAQAARPEHRGRRRGRLRPRPGEQPGRAGPDRGGHRQGRPDPGPGHGPGHRRGGQRVLLPTAATPSRAASQVRRRDDQRLRELAGQLPDRVAGGPAGRGGLGRLAAS